MTPLIPWARPHLFGDEAERIREALLSSWISGGPFIDQFEETIRHCVGAAFACADFQWDDGAASGFSGPWHRTGSESLCRGFAYLGAANIALLCGARPVFAKSIGQLVVDRRSVERVLTPDQSGDRNSHYGNMCKMDALTPCWPERNFIARDAAEALGRPTKEKRRKVWRNRHLQLLRPKTITTGEAGWS